MAKAEKRLPRARVTGKRIATVDQAIAAMGGDDHVATWLMIRRSELDGMRRVGRIDNGCALQFFVSLQALGHKPTPQLFGLRTWQHLTVPGAPALKL